MESSRRTMLVAILALAAGCRPATAGDEPTAWETDYARVRQAATDKNLPIVLSIGSDDCSWCKKLHATTFRNREIADSLARGFVTGKMDAARNRDLVRALKVQAFPTLVFAAPDGTILHTAQGYQTVEEMEATLRHTQTLLRTHWEKATLTSRSMQK